MGTTKSKKSAEPKARAEEEPEPEPTKKRGGRKAREEEPVVDEEDRPDPHQEDTGDNEPDADAKRRAKNRGYRQVAKKAGFSNQYDSGFSHLDCSTPVVSEAEVIRACKWAPRITDESAYSGIEEFEERTNLGFKSLPPGAARVFRAHSEAYLRRLVTNCVQRASDNQNTRVTVKEVMAELRPLQRVQKYTFVAPEGLIQYAMHKATGRAPGPERRGRGGGDQEGDQEADRQAGEGAREALQEAREREGLRGQDSRGEGGQAGGEGAGQDHRQVGTGRPAGRPASPRPEAFTQNGRG